MTSKPLHDNWLAIAIINFNKCFDSTRLNLVCGVHFHGCSHMRYVAGKFITSIPHCYYFCATKRERDSVRTDTKEKKNM